eukprot:8577827-Pyramimonas_sp.AAC.1
MARRHLKDTHHGPKRAKIASKLGQTGSEMAQDALQTAHSDAQGAPRGLQEDLQEASIVKYLLCVS